MRRFVGLSFVLLGGCLENNPIFVDPTEGSTQAGGSTDGGGPTSTPGTDSQPTSASDPTTTPPTTAGPGVTSIAETTDPTNSTSDTEEPSSSGMPPPACGDGALNPGEECDDGNQDPYDACTSECKNAVCGDGYWRMGVGGEPCDDGNDVDDDICSNDCKVNYCGDGVVQMGEVCDDNNQTNSDACVKCYPAKCGDKEVYQGYEECDDGNLIPGDGCEPMDCKKTVKIVFVSSKAYKVSQLGGLMGANMKCDSLAMAAKLPPGPYFAWLGDGVANGPKDHFMTKSPYPYVKLNMQMVAMSWAGLTSGNLLSPIDITEQNMPAPDLGHSCGPNPVHSNVKPDGDIVSKLEDCGFWKSDAGKGRWGSWKGAGAEWTYTTCAGSYCGEPARLYCIQQ